MNAELESQVAIDLLEKVHELEPLIREHSERAEEERKVSSPVIDALRDAGFFRMWVPKALGGLEIDLPSSYRIFEALANIDSAVGWAVPNANGPSMAGGALHPDAAQEIFGDPMTIAAGSPFPLGRAIEVEGGYRVSGTISFVSGCDFSNWIAGSTLVLDDGKPRMKGDKPLVVRCLYKAEDLEVTGNWNTLGMRGTGSHDVIVDDVFVPRSHTHELGPITNPNPPFDGHLYQCGPIAGTPFVTVVCLSSARNALVEALDLAAKKTPAFAPATVGDRPVAQSQLAQARAKLDAARAYLFSSIETLWECVAQGQTPTQEHKMDLQLAGSFGTQAAAEAIELIRGVAGTSAIQGALNFERYHRDIATLTQHAFTSASRFESVGKLMVDRPTDWAFLLY
ncbi:MAG: acyl-CoA dehydrogenase family protein [Chloroflexota bacterium]|nr:acyl-CoA dehydrogenase family protein [Chloroflexota bacterium]